jgi:hypothetical protein
MPAMKSRVCLEIIQIQEDTAVPTGLNSRDQLAIDEPYQVVKKSSQCLQVHGKISKE